MVLYEYIGRRVGNYLDIGYIVLDLFPVGVWVRFVCTSCSGLFVLSLRLRVGLCISILSSLYVRMAMCAPRSEF